MPNILKISCPARAKLVSTIKQVSAALRAMRFRRTASTLCVIARNEGIAAKGSTRKKIELSASTENRTSGAVRISFKAAVAGLVQSIIVHRLPNLDFSQSTLKVLMRRCPLRVLDRCISFAHRESGVASGFPRRVQFANHIGKEQHLPSAPDPSQ